MIYFAKIEGKQYRLEVDTTGERVIVMVDGRPVDLGDLAIGPGSSVRLLLCGRPFTVDLIKNSSDLECWVGSRALRCEIVDEKTARFASVTKSKTAARQHYVLNAPMPGLIVRVEVQPGQRVQKGDGLVIMEAMKMENELRAAHPGVVKEIKVTAGQAVEKNQPLVVLEE